MPPASAGEQRSRYIGDSAYPGIPQVINSAKGTAVLAHPMTPMHAKHRFVRFWMIGLNFADGHESWTFIAGEHRAEIGRQDFTFDIVPFGFFHSLSTQPTALSA